MEALKLSLIIPTFNERANVAPLLAQVDVALERVVWEAWFVDDSTDGTDTVIEQLAEADPHIHVIHRTENRDGLAGAVVTGIAEAQGQYICVLDADLQHPPSKIPELLAEAESSDADFVIASRYVDGGANGGLDGPARQFYSRGLKLLCRLAFPRRLAGVTDPLGGYFLVSRTVAQSELLSPIGYKILLELLVRCRRQTVREIPYEFEPRLFENSKSDFHQGLRFLRHLGRLICECSPVFAPLRLLLRSSASAAARRAGPLPILGEGIAKPSTSNPNGRHA